MSTPTPPDGDARDDGERELPEGVEEAKKDLEEMEEEIAPFTERKKFSRRSTGGGWRHESGVSYDGEQ